MNYLYGPDGQRHKIDHLRWVDEVTRLKSKSGSNPWPVIENCFNFWALQSPSRYRSFLISIDNTRETRKDREYASTKDPIHGGYLRYTMDIPEEVILMIRCIYNVDELPMNREFFNEFAKRFPRYRIAEKI